MIADSTLLFSPIATGTVEELCLHSRRSPRSVPETSLSKFVTESVGADFHFTCKQTKNNVENENATNFGKEMG